MATRAASGRPGPASQAETLLDEFEAYCWQVDHAEATGIYDRAHMSTLRQTFDIIIWTGLTRREIWETFSPEMKAYLRSRYRRTMHKIEAAPAPS